MNDVGDVDRMSVGRYASVLHSALLWKVFYVLSSKIRTPGQGREASSIVRVVGRGGDDKPHEMGYGFL